MSAQKAGGHGDNHGANDNLLHLIAAKEKELEGLVSAARIEAASIISQARVEAEAMVREAREQSGHLARDNEQRVAGEVARIQSEADTRGANQVETLRRQVVDRAGAAVRLVVDHVVKGTTA
ncbi:MAG: V-type ATPase subunit subunit G family protein [Armatimonadota bacterium]